LEEFGTFSSIDPEMSATTSTRPGTVTTFQESSRALIATAVNDGAALDADSVAVLNAHRVRQARARLAAGSKWVDTGLVFTAETGEAVHPADVTDHFHHLVGRPGNRPSDCTTYATEPPLSPSRPGWT